MREVGVRKWLERIRGQRVNTTPQTARQSRETVAAKSEDSERDLASESDQCPPNQGILSFICLILLCGTVYAGLKPFHAPANGVAWIADADALRFGGHGTILSSGSLPPVRAGAIGRSLEIWTQPIETEDSSTLIAFWAPENLRQLSLCQAVSDLEIRIQSSAAWRSVRTERINIADAFRDRRSTFWAVTFGQSGTDIYRNGVLVRSSAVRLSTSDFSGRLIVGNSPIFDDSWSGIVRGLAIYDTALDGTQIARHYVSWTKESRPALTSEDVCIALYLFNEHTGNVVHNRVRAQNDLYIPSRYVVLRPTLLDPVWRAFNWSLGFWKDAFINVSGFVPLGCFFCAYFSARGFRWPALHASGLCIALSVFIELTQTRLPTRDSSMADLINNGLGSILGAVAFRGVVAQAINQGISWIFDLLSGFHVAK
jgi:hypothetical protein